MGKMESERAELEELGIVFEPRGSSVSSQQPENEADGDNSPQGQAALVAAEIEAQMQQRLAIDQPEQEKSQALAPEKVADSTRDTDGGISDSDGDRQSRGHAGGGDMTSEADSSSGREWLRAQGTPQEESIEEGLTEAE